MAAKPKDPQVPSRRASVPLAELNADEKKFFELIETGSVSSAKDFIDKQRGKLNVNCTNYKGMTALHIAINNERADVVRMLLEQKDVHIDDAVLQAVDTGNIDLVTLIMEMMKDKVAEKAGCIYSTHYSSDIIPLALAAQKGDYKMIRMLTARGHELENPHKPTCLCDKCKEQLREHGASMSRIRLNGYRAITNPAFICQTCDDPVLRCFELDSELSECAVMDKEFRNEYLELGEAVREFTVELLNQCRDTTEVEYLLKLPNGFDFQSQKTDYPRLQLALDYKQKEFVANSMVQQVLTGHWLGEFRSWPRRSLFRKVLHVLFRVIFLGFISMFLLLMPWLSFLKKYNSPLNRFLLSLASYLLFLHSVFMVNLLDTGHFARGPPGTGFEGIVIIFVLGHIWSTIRQFWVEGYRRFFRAPWNWYDICMQSLFMFTFIFWAVSAFDWLSADVKKNDSERKNWGSFDATLVHEGLFTLASVLASGKLAYYCLQSSRLGPLQVSMGKMAVQIGIFLVLCFLIITAFSIPLTRMYAYYDGGDAAEASAFNSLRSSFTTLFWGMFGMSDAGAADVVVKLSGGTKGTHEFTQGVGRALFATYELLMIIALVNTLIAILSNTFQKVVDNADVEFKFHRTKLWIHFFDESTLVPSPWNLIPSASFFRNLGYFCKAMSNKVPGGKAKFSWQRCCYVERKEDVNVDNKAFAEFMSTLVQRYFRSKEED